MLILMLAVTCQANADSELLNGLALRGIGPALTSGRVADLAVDPRNPAHYYVAVASGGVWETHNSGTTFTPIFDAQGSYSIGCVTLDPSNPNTLWVGTGENNSQRSVGYGDGIYRSLDGGKTWTHLGLKQSEHIGRIVVHPDDSNTLFVAAQGPLWSDGGDRGLFKSTDQGDTWTKILDISEKTGVNEVLLDPRDPNTIYASAYQRRRHVWTLINGGPESAIYKSTDGGANFRKVVEGLPKVDLGRIGMAIAPSKPDTLYAVVEAAEGKGGFFRSQNRGESWEKMSDYVTGSPQYYQEIYVDPINADRIYAMDTWMQISDDAGATFKAVGERFKHVDNHALWIDPNHTSHLLAGCDGGVYETYDRGATWSFKGNLPITQFYRLTVDNAEPYYNVYGGTQDNFTLGGPSRTENQHGIVNSDWFVVVGGDGFKPQVDPENPNIVYGQAQYGYLVRHDRATGEITDIQPQPAPEGPPLKWNWDSPLLISHHQPARLYFGANVLFRSDDRGQSWHAISGDLTRQLDRNQLKVMDRIWPIDAVAKNHSTSIFGNIVAFAESPLDKDLLVAGTDDGLIHVTTNGGQEWRKLDKFPKVPDMTYVQSVWLSQHRRERLYAAFNNHKRGDFSPYLMVSEDLGKHWKNIVNGLPERGSVYAIAEDHVDPRLLFVGTEFGLHLSLDGGANWLAHKSGLPTVAIRDIAIQKREDDLVLASFGRGFFILDNYSPLRLLNEQVRSAQGHLFPIKDARRFVPRLPLGLRDKSFQGDNYYTAPNPPHGVTITCYLKEDHPSLQDQRREKEKEAVKANQTPAYPNWDQLRREALDSAPEIYVEIRNDQGESIRRIHVPPKKGIHRISWDMRWSEPHPVSLKPVVVDNPFSSPQQGHLAVPGTYSAHLFMRKGGTLTELGGPQEFQLIEGERNSVNQSASDVLTFQTETADLFKRMSGAQDQLAQLDQRLKFLEIGAPQTPNIAQALVDRLMPLRRTWADLDIAMNGDQLIAKYQEATLPGIFGRVATVVYGHWDSTGAVTQTHRNQIEIATDQYTGWLTSFHQLEAAVQKLEGEMVEAGLPYTPAQKAR